MSYKPADLIKAYGFPANLNGKGQTIAIISDVFASTMPSAWGDLTTFWANCGITKSLSDVTCIAVVAGSSGSASTETVSDVSWASAMAPGAKIRVYGIAALNSTNMNAALQQLYLDALADPTLRTLTISISGPETGDTSGTYLAQLAAIGFTIFVAAGDGGSNPTLGNWDEYSSGQPIATSYPSTSPYVTAVGGTNVVVDSNGNWSSETVWNQIAAGAGNATGGGVSSLFAKPSWQVGNGVPGGSFRYVPDVSLHSAGNSQPFYLVYGSATTVYGTSLASPVWAAIMAIINQACLYANRPLIGNGLNALVYQLIGTTAFHDITSGNNGAYSAGTGYDECTGVGSPNVINLIAALGGFNNPVQVRAAKGGTHVVWTNRQ